MTATFTKNDNLHQDFKLTEFTESEAKNPDEVKSCLDFYFNDPEGGEEQVEWTVKNSPADDEYAQWFADTFPISKALWNRGLLKVTSVVKDTSVDGYEDERGTVYNYAVELEEKPDPVVESVKESPAFQTAVELFKSCDLISILLNDETLGMEGYATGCLVDALAEHNFDDVALTPFQLQKLGEEVVDEAHRQWQSGAQEAKKG